MKRTSYSFGFPISIIYQLQVFARRHSVSRVTLVLLYANGVVTQVLPGMRQRAELRTVLKAHFDLHGTSGDALS